MRYSAFFSYARSDLDGLSKDLSIVREHLEREIAQKFGKEFRIFLDKKDIRIGLNWRDELKNEIDKCDVFFSIVTPSYLESRCCRLEVRRFLRRVIFFHHEIMFVPILWREIKNKDSLETNQKKFYNKLEKLQLRDCINLRTNKTDDQGYILTIEHIADQIDDFLQTRPYSPVNFTHGHPSSYLHQAAQVLRQKSMKDRDGLQGAFQKLPLKKFQFGSQIDEVGRSEDELPAMQITPRIPVALAKNLVTFDQYDAFCQATNRELPSDEGWGRGQRPVINVSWHDASAYCEWSSRKTGMTFRLPEELEWECACRAGSTTPFAFGQDLDLNYANFLRGMGGRTTPICSYPSNAWGFFDMHGNVREWTATEYWHPEGLPGSHGTAKAVTAKMVVRGGWWQSPDESELRSAFRSGEFKEKRDYGIGFRVAQLL